MERMKRRVHEILEVAAPGDRTSRLVDVSIMVLIILNVVAVSLETMEGLLVPYSRLFRAFGAFSVAVFSVEYLLRKTLLSGGSGPAPSTRGSPAPRFGEGSGT